MAERLAVFVGSLLLASCANQMKLAEADLAQIDAWLPGQYDNVEQARSDAGAGSDAHPALALTIVPVRVPTIGDHVFYMQESAADDPRRVTSQKLLSFDVAKGGHIVQTVWSLAEPQRWRDGHLNPSLFKGLMHQDASPLAGCELRWEKNGESRFVGANDPSACRLSLPALGGTVRMDMRAELSADSLALAELAFGANGQLVQGNAAEPFYRYRKRAAP